MAKSKLLFSKPVKLDHNQNFWYFHNIYIKTTKFFSVRSSLDLPIFKKIAVRSSPDLAKIGFSPDPVRSSSDPCSSLAYSMKMRWHPQTLKIGHYLGKNF